MKSGDIGAKHELVDSHFGFVLWMAAKYRGRGVDMDELRQAAALGLLEAMERYDPDRPTRLLTMAYYTVRRHIIEAIHDGNGYGGPGGPAKLSIDAGIPAEMWRKPASLYGHGSADDDDRPMCLADILEDQDADDPSDVAMEEEFSERAKRSMKKLKTRTRQIVRMRLGIAADQRPGMSFAEIASHFGISAERVRRIFIHAMRKMRRRMKDG